ncbi:1414_t:CDS:2, partial [Cetraspora pellucida]
NKTVSMTVLKSTFASPGSRYYIVMANNFVKDFLSDEPLTGANWSFITENKSAENLGIAESVLTRLNINESNSFDKLSKSDKSLYLYNLSLELSHSVPIDSSSIIAENHFQWDKNVDNSQILLKFRILPGNDNMKNLSVSKVIETINDLITNRDVTMISGFLISSKLDSQYGFKPK